MLTIVVWGIAIFWLLPRVIALCCFIISVIAAFIENYKQKYAIRQEEIAKQREIAKQKYETQEKDAIEGIWQEIREREKRYEDKKLNE